MSGGKINVAVVMGGISSEHEISIKSGVNVCNAIPRDRFNVKPVVITRAGGWLVGTGWLAPGRPFTGFPPGIRSHGPAAALSLLHEAGVHVVFIALHGPGGEDGTIQGFFETVGMPYTGSGVLGNAVGMDKILTKQVLLQEGIATPRFLRARTRELQGGVGAFAHRIETELGYPSVPKVSNQGSSHGVGIAEDRAALEGFLAEFLGKGNEILVEEYIAGRELTCAVIDRPGGQPPLALPPTELVPVASKFFDFHAKYTPGATEEITPARIDAAQTAEVQRTALAVHRALHCGGMSRTDMILRDGSLYVLEINTIPGMTDTSLVPQAARAVGIEFPDLLSMQLLWALETRGVLPPTPEEEN